jgi:SpoVK/Ycf46/Vps4 family AAA+-type ATPase
MQADKLNQAAKNDQVSYIFFATINDPKKVNQRIMRRSGRIDEMFEIGMPSANTMRYLFKYNDERVNKEHPTDFSDPKFDDVIQFAIESGITAADITNIFTDIVIYSGTEDIEKSPAELSGNIKDESNQDEAVCTPEKLKSAIERVNKRNKMSGNSYVDGDE